MDAPRAAGSPYVRWQVPGLPVITIRRRVADGIQTEVLNSFNAVPKRGAEVGGILLGSQTEDGILIEDFEPVPCEHRFGPSYQLSPADYDTLRETLEWFRSQPRHDISIVGFYRSHTRPEFSLSEDDLKLFSEHFAGPAQTFLLIKPNRMQHSVADFFFWRNGELRQGLHVMPFPFEEAAPAPHRESQAEPQHVATPPPVKPSSAVETPAPRPAKPARRNAVEDEEREPAHHPWIWGAVMAVCAILGGTLGYRLLHDSPAVVPFRPPSSQVQPAPEASEAAPAVPAPPAPEPAASLPPPVQPEPQPNDEEAIRSVLDRWAAAIRNGDEQTAAHCYAPRLTSYLGRKNARPSDILGRLRYMHGRYGKLAINRISNLSITKGQDVARADFRRHWESSGRGRTTGEEQVDMTLVRTQGEWKISSEQADRVY
jgi:hypothetical protein